MLFEPGKLYFPNKESDRFWGIDIYYGGNIKHLSAYKNLIPNITFPTILAFVKAVCPYKGRPYFIFLYGNVELQIHHNTKKFSQDWVMSHDNHSIRR